MTTTPQTGKDANHFLGENTLPLILVILVCSAVGCALIIYWKGPQKKYKPKRPATIPFSGTRSGQLSAQENPHREDIGRRLTAIGMDKSFSQEFTQDTPRVAELERQVNLQTQNLSSMALQITQLRADLDNAHLELQRLQAESLTDSAADLFFESLQALLSMESVQPPTQRLLASISRLCRRWLDEPVLAARMEDLLKNCLMKAETERHQLPWVDVEEIRQPDALARELVRMVTTANQSPTTEGSKDWEWVARSWRDVLFKLGHDLDAMKDDNALSQIAWSTANRDLGSIFEILGVQSIIAEPGARVDYERHEVIQRIPVTDVPANTIARTKRRGYVESDRVLRKAEVVVGVD